LALEGFDRSEIETLNFNVYQDYTWENGKRTIAYESLLKIASVLETPIESLTGDLRTLPQIKEAVFQYVKIRDLQTKKHNKWILIKSVISGFFIILNIFQWYQGDKIESLVLQTIHKFPKDKDIWNSCMCYLGNAGLVSGKVGESAMANAYSAKKERIEKWDQSNPKIKSIYMYRV